MYSNTHCRMYSGGIMIKLENVSKTYKENDIKAVDNLSIEIKPGRIFGFLGPNGAGKSTTIKMITGILPPDTGTITICGTDMLKDPVTAKQIIGFVPDEPVFYDKMSGGDFLSFIADIYGTGTAERQQAVEIAAGFGIDTKLQDSISSYSHGMKQKLSITAALMHKPEVFILDEPMSGLDPQSAFTLKQIMRRHCDEGKTVFFSTHVMEVVEKICDEVAIISKGKIIASGQLEDIRKGFNGGSDKAESLESIFLELTNESIHTS